jgi:hypothetical protein
MIPSTPWVSNNPFNASHTSLDVTKLTTYTNILSATHNQIIDNAILSFFAQAAFSVGSMAE